MTTNEVEPSRAHVYVETHKERKTRPTPMDEKSKQALEMINGKLSQLPDGKEVTTECVAWDGDVYSPVMKEVVGEERRGRVRGLGIGPSSLASLSSNRFGEGLEHDHDACNKRMKDLEANNKRLEDKVSRLENEQGNIQAELATLRVLVSKRAMEDATPSTSSANENGNANGEWRMPHHLHRVSTKGFTNAVNRSVCIREFLV